MGFPNRPTFVGLRRHHHHPNHHNQNHCTTETIMVLAATPCDGRRQPWRHCSVAKEPLCRRRSRRRWGWSLFLACCILFQMNQRHILGAVVPVRGATTASTSSSTWNVVTLASAVSSSNSARRHRLRQTTIPATQGSRGAWLSSRQFSEASKRAMPRRIMTSLFSASQTQIIGSKLNSKNHTTSQHQQQQQQLRSSSVANCWKTAVAGGIAGATGTMILYPLDAAKTIRQASPHLYPSILSALRYKYMSRTVYRGLGTAVIGAMPSSALYFGAYETMRQLIGRYWIVPQQQQQQQQQLTQGITRQQYKSQQQQQQQRNEHHQRQQFSTRSSNMDGISLQTRCIWHAASAASGNMLSSAVFVPKELIKQKLQFTAGTGTTENVVRVVTDILAHNGIRGLYRGYRATVLRNIPSAALRFILYEEFKRYVMLRSHAATTTSERRSGTPFSNNSSTTTTLLNWRLFGAGAAAGALASGIMTPIDVVKTKIATGTCPVDMPSCFQSVVSQYGVSALWTGAGSRMLSSAAFSAIGFGTYEAVKRWLGVTDVTAEMPS